MTNLSSDMHSDDILINFELEKENKGDEKMDIKYIYMATRYPVLKMITKYITVK